MKRAGDHHARVEVRSASDLRAWLVANHAQGESIWLVTGKAGSSHYIPYGEIVDQALCFGWIDSLPRALDDNRTMRLLSPRSDKSLWSAVNRAKVEALTAAGRMAPAGLAAVARAKASGRWNVAAIEPQREAPDDLATALARSREATRHWEAFPPSTKKAILEWIHAAKRPETRAARIAGTVEKAKRGERANQWRQPKGAGKTARPSPGK